VVQFDQARLYLLQRADNPVDWWPWVLEAFEEARRRDVPVLSVGYLRVPLVQVVDCAGPGVTDRISS
jgi:uncharacterized protein YyaL (SSP411 family)